MLLTYRVKRWTVFYLGFDTRYRHGDHHPTLFPRYTYRRTNRAVFTSCSTCLDTHRRQMSMSHRRDAMTSEDLLRKNCVLASLR